MVATFIHLAGYEVVETLYDGSRTLVYRAIRHIDRKFVILKLLKNPYPDTIELVHFKNQYTLTKDINLPGVVRSYQLETYQNRFVIVTEDFGGISLRQYAAKFAAQRIDVGEFLSIAIKIAEILADLYQHRIIHKDIKPDNLLINPQTKQVKLIDFSIASLLPQERQTATNPSVLEGTIAYLSPEQTGRMNRGIDYRTDFYSLGATFYELLTGQLPFQSDDAMELIYAHIAKQPISIEQINPAVPHVLTAIVRKLMAKNAEERYQSARGLKHDLEICQREWNQTGQISQFEIGQQDYCDRWVMPQKLYGRDREVEMLIAAYDRIAQGASEIILVAGVSGMGKTAVIQEVQKPLSKDATKQRGYLIQGKFDQFQRNIPFSAFIQAFRDLIRQLLTESTAQLERWRLKLLRALGENAQVLIEVIPELETILGEQCPASKLTGIAAQNRFNLLLQQFIQVFAQEHHPLVIFLDDLQWADLASLNLMQVLMEDSNKGYLLLIGTYREEEVSIADFLMLTLDKLRQNGTTINTIALTPLEPHHLNQMIAETLNYTSEQATPLTELVYHKTKGNPFFSRQFLKLLYEEKLIQFDLNCGVWNYDLARSQSLMLGHDVVTFMASQLQKLPESTQAVLKLAACIGNSFDLEMLSAIAEQSPNKTAANLWAALQEELIFPSDDNYKVFQDHSVDPIEQSAQYRFAHDQIQQAAYQLIEDNQKPATHLKIGELLLRSIPEAEREEHLFAIVNSLNLGATLVSDSVKREELARLNLRAGQKAKASTAYQTAVDYCKTGIELLGEDCWQSYDLALKLHEEAAETAYLSGHFTQTEQWITSALQQAKTPLEQVRLYQVKIEAEKAQGNRQAAIATGFTILSQFGIILPEQPTEIDVQHAFGEAIAQLAERNIADLLELPPMTNLNILSAMRILASMTGAAYFVSPTLAAVVILQQVKLSLQYGNAPESAFAYAAQGQALCGMGEIDKGYQFGQLAIALLDRYAVESLKPLTMMVVNSLVKHWREPIHTVLPNLLETYQLGLKTGDLEAAAFALHNYCAGSYYIGKELTQLVQEISTYTEAIAQLKQETPRSVNQMLHQVILNLINPSENPYVLIGEGYDESIELEHYQQRNDYSSICKLYVQKLILAYLFGQYEQALEYSDRAKIYLDSLSSDTAAGLLHFYDSLARLAVYPNVSRSEQSQILVTLTANQAKLSHWSTFAPVNYQHRFELVEAERHRVFDQKLEAIEQYDRAIATAQKNGYLHEAAIANERAVHFYCQWQKEKLAQSYFADTYYGYLRWGALAKVQQLETAYPQQFSLLQLSRRQSTSHITTSSEGISSLSSSMKGTVMLDFFAIVKASQALSSAIELEKLISALMQLAIENAGAERCVFMRPENEQWQVIAEATPQNGSIIAATPVEESELIPQSIVHYVMRTSDAIVLDRAYTEAAFASDAYLRKHQSKSVLCTPVQNQGQTIGILYLENNLTTAAFTSDRLEVLQILTAQAAISLQNAMLYRTLEQKVEQRTQELQQKNHSLSKALKELKMTQAQLIQSEKMSSLGQMIAGIAHEINNPITFIHSNLTPASNYFRDLLDLLLLYQREYPNPTPEIETAIEQIDLEFMTFDLQKLLTSMRSGSERIRDIVLSLRTFSRLDESEMKSVDLHAGVDSVLLILQHRLNATTTTPEIQVVRTYSDLPKVECYANQINQALMNLISNAIDALLDRSQHELSAWTPTIEIQTEVIHPERVAIRIKDNGIGMSQAVMKKIFDPFFTTKPVGSGTGLGSSIAYQIVVEKHHGHLSCESTPGQGTEFVLELPIETKPLV
ncbi:trifunctional serine/threonine-protein kinase/ATP-binding protein/sensor histidine kinase [Leptolyngbya sp. NIES-2104]|uniref:trifunctional serine/threonine-protein kinase/ATP-binding protein/sensor histidine kinase n=1 Tax=Leptolyngbya sp. NIES-2104 TaxID=1552121 RepID=UPI0006EC848F|nr:ATP-binding sensor histidine kinase [Leptolyngbya sp. NIES-2104]GAP99219.1 serine/threonine protein kinase PrkC [Leptolyngbya sp. NIES-2104]